MSLVIIIPSLFAFVSWMCRLYDCVAALQFRWIYFMFALLLYNVHKLHMESCIAIFTAVYILFQIFKCWSPVLYVLCVSLSVFSSALLRMSCKILWECGASELGGTCFTDQCETPESSQPCISVWKQTF